MPSCRLTSEAQAAASTFLLGDGAGAAASGLKWLKDDADRVQFALGLAVRLTNWHGGCNQLKAVGVIPTICDILRLVCQPIHRVCVRCSIKKASIPSLIPST